MAAVLDRTHKGRTGVDYPSGSEEARLAHKRSQGELYESRTPYSSPAPASAAEAERLRLRAEAEAQPSGSLEAQREASLQAPSSHVQRADVPYEHGAAVSSGGEEAKGQAGAPQVPSPSLHSVDNQRKVVVAKYLVSTRMQKDQLARAPNENSSEIMTLGQQTDSAHCCCCFLCCFSLLLLIQSAGRFSSFTTCFPCWRRPLSSV